MSKSNSWRYVTWGECPSCGAEAMVLTDGPDDNKARDGDDAKCAECALAGIVSVDPDDGCAWINWEDVDDDLVEVKLQ